MELWGLGDLTFASAIIPALLEEFDLTILGKPHARPLLEPSFPSVNFVPFDAPWTAFRHKYDLRRWHWRELFALVADLRARRFDAALSVRHDPRDHALLWLSGASRRYSFPKKGSNILLTDAVSESPRKEHRVEEWRRLGSALGLSNMEKAQPALNQERYRSARIDRLWENVRRPVICIHAGARVATRRWPESAFAYVLQRLKNSYPFDILLIPDPDGFGASLAPFADHVTTDLTIPELVDLLGRIDILFCNDSAPGHIAAACGRPVIAVFGPTDPDWFHPWNNSQRLIIRDICPWRPCFDYCKFSEPHCLTKLSPELVWPEIKAHIDQLVVSESFRTGSARL